MSIEREFRNVLKRANKMDYPDRELLITAFISEKLGKLTVAGGLATAVYSRGAYRTMDVDVVAASSEDEENLRSGLGKLLREGGQNLLFE